MALTDNQRMVLDALREDHAASGAYALLGRLEGTGVRAPTQIYRALARLESEGLAHRVESLNAYVPCRLHDDAAPHGAFGFAVCTGCGLVDELELPGIAENAQAAAAGRGFVVESTAVELRGLCEDCAAA